MSLDPFHFQIWHVAIDVPRGRWRLEVDSDAPRRTVVGIAKELAQAAKRRPVDESLSLHASFPRD